MDMNYFSIFLFIFKITDVRSTLFYSGSELYTYDESKSACSNLGGNMLHYGMVFVNATIQCQQHSYIWIGLPFYTQLRGCYKGSSSKRTPPGERSEDKRVALCADFCSDNSFTHFGLMTTECHCYTKQDFDNLQHTYMCQYPSCPGNSFDMCGASPYSMVFEKETDYSFSSCQSRQILQNGDSHEVTRFCFDKLPVWCQVGNGLDVQCSFPSSTSQRTTAEEQTTTDPFSSSTMPKDSTSAVFEVTTEVSTTTTIAEITIYQTTVDSIADEKSSTFQMEKSTETLPSSPADVISTETISTNEKGTTSSSDNTIKILSQSSIKTVKQGTIIGVTLVAVLLVSVLFIVLIVRIRRQKKTEGAKERDQQYPEPSVFFTNMSESDRQISYENNWSTEDNSYDSYGYSQINRFKRREPMYDQEILFIKNPP